MKIMPRIRMPRWTVIFLVIFVSGCQALGTHNERYYGNENSPNFRVPTDSIFVLNQELIVARKRKRAFFQFGRVLAQYHQVNRHQPWCVLRLRAKKDTVQRIEPDRFIVRSVQSRALYQIALIGPVKVAQRRRAGHDFNYQVFASEMELGSERQPDVRNLACARWRTRSDYYSVRIRDIRETLGNTFTLELATKSGSLDTKISRTLRGPNH